MHRPVILAILRALAGVVACGCVSSSFAADANIRWAFVTNFARYAEWPASKWASPNAPLNVCLLPGDRDMAQDIATIEKHVVGGRAVRGVLLSKPTEIEPCAVLYVPADFKTPIKPILELAVRQRVLTISDREDFIEEGGVIALAPSGGRYVFDVNLVAARSSEIKLSSQLLKLARSVK
jgi:hypothetical protein